MKKQYAVFGLGNFGQSVALTLQKLGCDVVAVDRDMSRVEAVADSVSFAMRADIEDPNVLKSLEERNLDGVIITSAQNVEASIMATLHAKEMNIPLVIVKANNEMHAQVLKKIGADKVVFPEKDMGIRMAYNLVSHSFAEWITLSPQYSIVEEQVPKHWVGKNLEELNVRKHFGINIVGIRKEDAIEINPDPKKALEDENVLILIGENEDLEALRRKL